MYSLRLLNNFIYPITTNDGIVIKEHGGTHSFDKLGNVILNVMGLGAVNFMDLGDKKIPGYKIPKETWGVLVRTHTIEAYYRYEGGGNLLATFDIYGTCTLSTSNGGIIPIELPELIIQ